MNPPDPIPPRVQHNKALYDRWMTAHGIDPRFNLLQPERLPPPSTDPVGIIDLPNVTLWASVEHGDDLYYLQRVVKVLRYMNRFCRFKTTRLLSYLDPGAGFEFEWIKVEPVEKDQISAFLNQVAPQHLLDSDFSFSVHEDGFMLYPEMWDPAFLEYDYIGAPWLPLPGIVGNGGFCIESRRMNEAKLALPKDTSNPLIWADQYVCCTHRAALEAQGLKWAPVPLAGKFSVDLMNRTRKSFGFHGKRMVPLRYAEGWKKIAASERSKMNIEIVYVYWAQHPEIEMMSKRFVDTYYAHPPGETHKTTIVCNGGRPTGARKTMFDRLPNVSYIDHDDSGWDIGAFIAAAKQSTDEMAVYMGTSIYFYRSGWLSRMVDAWMKHGPGMYGMAGTFEGSPHLNTTGFWCSPKWLAEYPYPMITKNDRYNFENGVANKVQAINSPDLLGSHALWRMIYKKGLPVLLVTWDGEYEWWDWRKPANIFKRGNQSNMLLGWHHGDRWYAYDTRTKTSVSAISNKISDPHFNLAAKTFIND